MNVIDNLDKLSWPISRLGEAMEALARKSGISPRPVEMVGLARDGGEALGQWLSAAADCLGIEAEPKEGTEFLMGATFSVYSMQQKIASD